MNIGLLAMSGVRAHDAKLMALGLTLPGFVERSRVIASLPSLGLLYLAAVTPPGHVIHYYEAEGDGKEPAEIYDCDLVAISTFSAQIFEAYAIADRLRATGVKVAMGGLHVTALPEEAAGHADYVVIGEGERTWPEVVRAAERGEAARVFRAREFGAVLADKPRAAGGLPVPRYDLLGERPVQPIHRANQPGVPVALRLLRVHGHAGGALSEAAHCGHRPRHRGHHGGPTTRTRPFIEFADNNTFVDKSWGKELCRALKPLRLKWFTETDITVGEDEELLELMREAGCRQVLVGLESPTRGSLEGIELHANIKARWSAHYRNSIRRIQRHGVTVNGCFILGLDGHTADIFREVLDFVEAVPLYEVQITTLTAFPGTPLYRRLLGEGRIIAPGHWELCTLFDVNYEPRGMTVEALREGLYWLGERLYSAAALARRRAGFYRDWKEYREEAHAGT